MIILVREEDAQKARLIAEYAAATFRRRWRMIWMTTLRKNCSQGVTEWPSRKKVTAPLRSVR